MTQTKNFDAIDRMRTRAFELFCKGVVSTGLLALVGCEVRVDAGLKPQNGTADTPTTDSTGSTLSETDPGTSVESDGDEDTLNTDPGSDPDGSVKFDLMVPDTSTDEGCDPRIDPNCNCGAVDILFVVDNSFSANRPQESLAEAFPPFMAAIVEAMPGNTNIHVGITSTTMGYTTQSSTENCFSPDADDWYHPPDTNPNTEIAAQGRLHEYDGRRFFEIETNATQDQFDELNEWFANAVLLGSGGSQVTMSTAAAAWALDPINEAHNRGFLRDEGAVLALLVVQHHPDLTPTFATQALLEKISDAKKGCGGMRCVVGGGLVNESCLPEVPLGRLFDSLGAPAATDTLPFLEEVDTEAFVELLRDIVADMVATKCSELEPEG